MKRTILFISLAVLSLVGCNPKKETSPQQTVKLAANNYSYYIAINTIFAAPNPNYSDVVYYSYFIGSDHCKFIDCKISYKYVLNGGSVESSVETIQLTLSGDGQANPFYARLNNRGNNYSIVVTDASGTVQVL